MEGPPTVVENIAGDGQTAIAGTILPVQPWVLVTDVAENLTCATPITLTKTVDSAPSQEIVTKKMRGGGVRRFDWTLNLNPDGNLFTASCHEGALAVFSTIGPTGPFEVIAVTGQELEEQPSLSLTAGSLAISATK